VDQESQLELLKMGVSVNPFLKDILIERLEMSIISDHRYVKMQGKIRDNAKAFESEVIHYVSLNRGHCLQR